MTPDKGPFYAYDFPRWKQPILRQCLTGQAVTFICPKDPLPSSGVLLLWGMAPAPNGLSPSVSVWRVEDGFLRSVGLSADLARPLSWVLDQSGIYYDASRPSGLEKILAETGFDEALCARAASLRARIAESGVTKYNMGAKKWQRSEHTRRVILVPGQVESDASLAFGSPEIRTNMGLLQAVRAANPTAYLLYKPHPDVWAGLRAAGIDESEAARWSDEIVTETSMGELLTSVDAVHVMTSLAGFEALLRGKETTCYGQPFYAGWGLTQDKAPLPRRTRILSLDELVAGALILYPRYLSRDGKSLTTPEEALESLICWRAKNKGRLPWWSRLTRFLIRRMEGVTYTRFPWKAEDAIPCKTRAQRS